MNNLDKQQPQDGIQEPIIIQEKISKKNEEVVIRKYQRGKALGKGGFATCYEVTDLEQNRILAAKVVSKASLTKKRALEKLLAEIKIHKSLRHENIVQFERVFEDKENVYILLEICPNQTLKELLKRRKRITEVECVLYMTQTINALKYLHEKKIIHRDLKLGNLLLGKAFDIKVADFGLAAKIEHDGEKRRTICGTPNYIAPEVLDKKQGHSYEVDIWSLGVICYTLLIGRPPFETNDTKATYRRILKNNYTFPSNVFISEDAKDLIKKILVLDPTQRPGLDDILNHPFIKNHATKSAINQSQGKKSLNQVSQLPGFTQPSDIGFNIPTQTNLKDNALDKNVYENDVHENLVTSKDRLDKGKTISDRPHSLDPRPDYAAFKSENRTASDVHFRGNNYYNSAIPLDTHVSKWIDYTNKYGLAYLLSDGTSGVLFNDSTKMTMAPESLKLEYLDKGFDPRKGTPAVYNMNSHPKELEKKVLLLKHFKNYLLGETDRSDSEREPEQDNNNAGPPLVYVKRWLKTKHAVLFRLSNKLVQVDFEDKTQIVLNAQHQVVHYKGKKGEQSQYPLATALDVDHPEMVKRLKYAKEILVHIREKNTQGTTNNRRNSRHYENGLHEQPDNNVPRD